MCSLLQMNFVDVVVQARFASEAFAALSTDMLCFGGASDMPDPDVVIQCPLLTGNSHQALTARSQVTMHSS